MNAVEEGQGADRSAGKVVSLRERGPIPRESTVAPSLLAPQSAMALSQARAIADRHLAATVNGVMQAADNTLFELAQKSDNSSVQSDYFSGMRVLRRRRAQVEQAFSEELRRAFSRIERHEVVAEAGEKGGESLQLVSDEEMEEEIAIASIVSAVHGFASRMLFPINERMTALAGGGYQVGDHNNPIAPRSLAMMMRASLRDVELVPNVRLILLKLFERATLEQCEKLYVDVNAALLAAGVLPTLRMGARRDDPRGAAGGPVAAATGAAGAPSDFTQQGAYANAQRGAVIEPGDSEVYSAVLSLLQSRHVAAPAQSFAPHAPLPMSGNELRSILTLLQAQSLPRDSNHWAHADVASLQQFKASLAEQARAVGVDPKRRHVAHADEDTIDLVGMLFEVILDDRNLHAKVKSLLSRLMVPYIKLALMDRHLFLQRTHPARRLLNEMANATVGYQEDVEQDERLLSKVASVVEALLQEFDEDASVFQRLEADFSDFLTRHRKRTDLVEQRAADTVRGRERLAQARRNSQNEFDVRVSSKELPKLVSEVLARYWTHHLTITELRQGVDSADYRDALQLGSHLVAAAEARARGGVGLPAERVMDLRDRLARVLALAGCGADQAQPIVQGLVALIEEPISAAPEPFLVIETASQLIAASPAVVASDDEEQPSSIAPAEMPSEADVVDHLESAGAISLGKWVDFVGTNGESQQAKLAWISPISNRLLFVNRRGLKVGLYSLQELAALMAVNRLRVHDGVPAFDRAMRTVVEKLGTQSAARA